MPAGKAVGNFEWNTWNWLKYSLLIPQLKKINIHMDFTGVIE
jgi:hypothetical protein